MMLYEWKTDKYDWIVKPYALPIYAGIVLVAANLILLKDVLYFVDPYLFLIYGSMVCWGTYFMVEYKKIHLPQALSFAFSLAFFNSVYWETPIRRSTSTPSCITATSTPPSHCT